MKKVLILGATGTAGKAICKKLLADTDCFITLFSRHASDVDMQSKNAEYVSGDATILEELEHVVEGKDIVYCAISGEKLPIVANNLVVAMKKHNVTRLIFMGAVGIYNEIPDEIDGKDNVDNEPAQIPNRDAVFTIENSDLNYTILRPGYLRDGNENDYVLTKKGDQAKGYITTIPSLVNLAIKIILDDGYYLHESVSITKDMAV